MQRRFLKSTQVWEINRTGTRYIARWGESIDALIDSLLENGYVEQAHRRLFRVALSNGPLSAAGTEVLRSRADRFRHLERATFE